MNKEDYYKYIEENDTYPEHSHKWIVRTYIDTPYGPSIDKMFYRNFGTFETKEEAKEFIENYKVKYTTKGFITRYSIQGVCEVLCLRTPDEIVLENVKMFHLENMTEDVYWCGIYLNDGRIFHLHIGGDNLRISLSDETDYEVAQGHTRTDLDAL